jgi:hypothetical protein
VPMDGGRVWKGFGLNWWGNGRGRAVERCAGGGHHGFHVLALVVTVNESVSHRATIEQN